MRASHLLQHDRHRQSVPAAAVAATQTCEYIDTSSESYGDCPGSCYLQCTVASTCPYGMQCMNGVCR